MTTMRRRNTALIVLVVLLLVIPTRSRAFAVPAWDDAPVTLSLEYRVMGDAVPDARFDLYKVGGMEEADDATNRDGWGRLAQQMARDIDSRGTEPLRSVVTDSEGRATFGGEPLDTGLYLVSGHDVQVGQTVFTSFPFLITLPLWDVEERSWSYDVHAMPKAGMRSVDNPTTHDPLQGETAYADSPNNIDSATIAYRNDYSPYGLLSKMGELRSPWREILIAGLGFVLVGMIRRRFIARDRV